MVNALTVDVEDYFHVQAFAEVISPSDWSHYSMRVEKNTCRLLDLFERHQVRATFFILGWVAERCPDLISKILIAGHEIGCHGYSHQMIGQSTEQEFQDDIHRAKSILEDLSGVRIKSYRAPSYSITERTLWALEILHEAGFEFDSSIFPVVHDCYGIPDAPRFPHYKVLNGNSTIIEFPPSTLNIYGVNVPVAGGGYFRLFPYRFTSWAIRRINENEFQPVMFYVHPWEIDPEQPRIPASLRSRFRHYQNLHSTEEKLTRLLDEFLWAPMSEVLALSLSNVNARGEVINGF